jgi:hypothetical protein
VSVVYKRRGRQHRNTRHASHDDGKTKQKTRPQGEIVIELHRKGREATRHEGARGQHIDAAFFDGHGKRQGTQRSSE